MVVVKDIEFYSLCEHHLLPFFGKVHVGYIPDGKIVGLSKIPRIVDMFALATSGAGAADQGDRGGARKRAPPAVAWLLLIDGMHMCMMMRGVEKQYATMITSHVMGEFRDDRATRSEFMSLVKGNGKH